MTNDNISSLAEIREMVKVATVLEEALAETGTVSADNLVFADSNGEKIAELRFVGDLGGYTLIFAGQEYSDESS